MAAWHLYLSFSVKFKILHCFLLLFFNAWKCFSLCVGHKIVHLDDKCLLCTKTATLFPDQYMSPLGRIQYPGLLASPISSGCEWVSCSILDDLFLMRWAHYCCFTDLCCKRHFFRWPTFKNIAIQILQNTKKKKNEKTKKNPLCYHSFIVCYCVS